MTIVQKVLFVDDEPNVLEGIKRQLRREFDIDTALGPQAALESLVSGGPYAVVVSDYNMPGMNGVELLSELRRRAPDTVGVMLTGRTDLDVAISAMNEGHVFRFLTKPCSRENLVGALSDALHHYRLVQSERLLAAQLAQTNAQLNALNRSLEARVAERTHTLQCLYDFVAIMNGMPDIKLICQHVALGAARLTGAERAALWLMDTERRVLSLSAAHGFDPATTEAGLMDEPWAMLFFAQNDVWVADPRAFPDFGESCLFGASTLACAVLSVSGAPLGLLTVASERQPESADLTVLRPLAESAAVALRNQQHREERNEAQDAIIMALAKLSEYRDPETGEHLLRLKAYCRMLCEALVDNPDFSGVVTPAFIDDVVRSSPLHDIGKVGIPDHILKKPGKHTEAEFALMKTHATIGGDMLRSVLDQCRNQGFIKTGMEIAYGHHEKWDGSGYPRGLAGEDIPLAARVLALADVYDALTTPRVYKPRFPHSEACRIITEGSGRHFDPRLVAAFLQREAEFSATADRLADRSVPSDSTAADISLAD